MMLFCPMCGCTWEVPLEFLKPLRQTTNPDTTSHYFSHRAFGVMCSSMCFSEAELRFSNLIS